MVAVHKRPEIHQFEESTMSQSSVFKTCKLLNGVTTQSTGALLLHS